jgi:hypothetical protein
MIMALSFCFVRAASAGDAARAAASIPHRKRDAAEPLGAHHSSFSRFFSVNRRELADATPFLWHGKLCGIARLHANSAREHGAELEVKGENLADERVFSHRTR